jgi:hypothetical protein
VNIKNKKGETQMKLSQMKFKVCSLVALAVLCLPLAAHAQGGLQVGTIQGKLWVVSPQQARVAAFPPPSEPPDVTFSTNSVAYIGQEIGKARYCYTMATFLNGCETQSFNVFYSGLPNPNLPGGVGVTRTTPLGGPGEGTIMEFTGSVELANGETIETLANYAVALMIDGDLVISGYDSHFSQPTLALATWTGTTGSHSFDLLYANPSADIGGDWILLLPKLD